MEALRIGDEVVLAEDGQTRAVIWLGHRSIDCRLHPRPQDVLPVRIRADAFGPGQPRCDLILSPDHAVFADNVLIPVRAVVNGDTIAALDVESVEYFHVELFDHAVILAEGLACESYLDTDEHERFANRDTAPERLTFMEPCALIVTQGEVVERVRRRIRACRRALAEAA